MKTACFTFAFLLGLTFMTNAETRVDQLLSAYDAVKSVTCEVRKETEAENGPKVRMLSRVHYEKTDKLHVETYSPVRRRIIANGKSLYSFIDGDPKGYKKPVEELDREWQISLRKVPATPMDHLLRLKGAEEVEVPNEKPFKERLGYNVENRFVVLGFDKSDRLARIEFYETESMSEKTGTFDYSDYEEAVPGAWFPLLTEGVIEFGDVVTRESVYVTNLKVNKSIAPDIFKPGNYFKDKEFASEFSDIYGN